MEQSDIIGPAAVPLPGSDMFLLGATIVLGVVAVAAIAVISVVRLVRRRRGVPPRRPVGLVLWGATAVVSLCLGLVLWPFGFSVPEFPALPRLFPENAFFYRPTSDLEVADGSQRTIDAIGDLPFVAAPLGSVKDGRTRGIPFNFVDRDTPRHRFDFTYPGASNDTAYPIPDPAYVQSMPFYRADNHYVGIDLESRQMWELASVRRWFWFWQAGAGALWDLDSLEYPKGHTTASGVPLVPLSYTYEQVASGSIDHVLMVSLPTVRAEEYQWPARHTDGPVEDPDAPVMGTWFRLRSDADLSRLGPQARVVAEALQQYGAVLGDTGGSLAFTGTPDNRWDDDDLATLGTLSSDDLEVIDASAVMVDPESMEAAR
jgi:hypothetical protein